MNNKGIIGRIAGSRRRRRDADLLRREIDAAHYRAQLADPTPTAADLARHYLEKGWLAGVDPAPWFNAKAYGRAYPDVQGAPFLHYLAHGRAEGREPAPFLADLAAWFDAEDYLDRHPDVARTGADALEHFAGIGWREGRDPADWFSMRAWREANPAAPPDVNPFALHLRDRLERGYRRSLDSPVFDRAGWTTLRERVEESGLVDARYYLSTYPELAGRGLDPLEHYLVAGAAELRNPGPGFDTGWWAARRGVALDEALADFLDRQRGETGRPPATAVFTPGVPAGDASYAVYVHLGRPELVESLAGLLAAWPTDLHLWVGTGSEPDAAWLRHRLAERLPRARLEVRPAPCVDGLAVPVAFADLAGRAEVVLCARLGGPPESRREQLRRQAELDALFADPAAATQAAAWFASHPALAWLCPETHRLTRLADAWAAPGRLEPVGWLYAAALPALAAAAGDPPGVFELEAASWAVEDGLATDLAARLAAVRLGWAPFVWAERPHVAPPPPPPPPASRRGPYGRRWPREDPAIAARRPQPLQPRSKVYDPARLDIAWIVPDVLRGSGGQMSILRLVEQLAALGHRQTLWIQNPRGPDPLVAKRRMQAWFRPIPEDVAVVALPDDTRAVSADVVIATEAWTAFPAANVVNAKARFYLIQDYEPLFYGAGDAAILAEQSYGLGLDALTAGDWLLGKARGHGLWARKWDLAVDAAAYFPPAGAEPSERGPRKAERPVRIAVYARASTPRRAVGLAFAALTELHRRGVAFQAALFGDEAAPTGLAFPHVHLGLTTPEQLGDLYRACDIGLVFSATNYSLVPLEMMACGLPVVELDGESTRAVFAAGEVALAAPDVHAVADALQALAASPEARADQAARGRAFVQGLSWERSARQLEGALLERLAATGAAAIDTAAVCTPAVGRPRRVSVVIPTYNGGRLFDRVLAAAAAQDCPFDYDLLVIDSGSTDRTAEMARKAGGRVRLHTIEKAEFQHGRTRNLGVEMTDGDIVAFLTQDALPADGRWLARLVEAFDASPRTALAFGRHRAYPAHGPYAARDLDDLFDHIRDLGPLFSNRLGLPSFVYAGGEDWRRLIGFHSDNNSALLRGAWRHLPYPEIAWGEDQVLGWEMVRQGFDKAYVDEAVVFHSHQRKASEQLQTAAEEGLLYKREFGLDLIRPPEAAGLLAAMKAQDRAWGEAEGLSDGVVAMRLDSLRLSIEGRLKGAAMAGD